MKNMTAQYNSQFFCQLSLLFAPGSPKTPLGKKSVYGFWHLGILAPWHLGILASWHLGILASWHFGILGSWHLGVLAS
jgi:hypothetical protein